MRKYCGLGGFLMAELCFIPQNFENNVDKSQTERCNLTETQGALPRTDLFKLFEK